MPGIARKGIDSAGGLAVGGSNTVFVNGAGVVRLGDAIAPHGDGAHANATMVQASSSVYADGIRVCRAGDLASCGHAISGSSDVEAG